MPLLSRFLSTLLAAGIATACAVDVQPEHIDEVSSAVAYGAGSTSVGSDAFAAGRNVHANGETSAAFGDDCTTSHGAYRAFVAGHSSHSTAPDTITLGENCSSTADGAVAIGYTASATASWGFALGAYVTAGGMYSSSRGLAVSTSRPGEDAHGSGHPGVQGFHAIDLNALADHAPAVLKQYDGQPFRLDTQTANAMRIRVLALKADGSVVASEERALTVTALPGPIVTVLGEASTTPAGGLAAKGWGFTVTSTGSGSLELRFTCDPGCDAIKCMVRVEWSQIAIPS